MNRPEAGDVRVTVQRYERLACENCGEDATHRLTFLLEGARSNPASKAYGKDDCSWCADEEALACDACETEMRHNPPDGYTWCSDFRGERFAHMLHGWVTLKGEDALAAQAGAK